MEWRTSNRSARCARAAAWVVAAAAAGPVVAGPNEAARSWDEPVEVRAVQPRPIPNGLRLEIQLSGPASFRCRALRHPDRIAIDIRGARLLGMPYELRVGLGGVDRVWARQNGTDTVRVVAGCAAPMHVDESRAADGLITIDLLPGRDDKRTERAGDGGVPPQSGADGKQRFGRGADSAGGVPAHGVREGGRQERVAAPGDGGQRVRPGDAMGPFLPRAVPSPRRPVADSAPSPKKTARDLRRRAAEASREARRRPDPHPREECRREARWMEPPVEEPSLAIPEPHFPPPAVVDPAAVTGLTARNLSPDTAEIRLQAGRRLEYRVLRLEQPARYVVDLAGGRDGLFCSPLVEGEGLLGHRDVRTGQFTENPPVFRLVVHLPERAWAEVRTEDSGEMVVEVTRRHAGGAARTASPPGSPGAGTRPGEARGRSGPWPEALVGIDPGHGGSDPGASPMVGMPEKDITLDIGLRVRELLAGMGIATAMTRREDRRLPVKERIRFVGRADLDLFLSIHCDAAESTSATGVTTYIHGWDAPSRALALALQGELVRATGLPDRGVRSDKERYRRGGFYVLRYAAAPAVLIEAGYVSHPATALQLSYPGFRQRVAQGIVAGLQKYWERMARR